MSLSMSSDHSHHEADFDSSESASFAASQGTPQFDLSALPSLDTSDQTSPTPQTSSAPSAVPSSSDAVNAFSFAEETSVFTPLASTSTRSASTRSAVQTTQAAATQTLQSVASPSVAPSSIAKPEEIKAESAKTEASKLQASKTGAENAANKSENPRLPTNLPVDFVDLYQVIGLKRDALIPDIRKRITELYLDAQNNLDHRNAKKKLHYQQLFEVTLPQARHLLLDPDRRAEYDKYLDDYHVDEQQRAVAEKALAENPFIAQTSSVEEAVKKAREEEEQLTPAQLAARRAELWRKWEESLAHANDPLAQLKFSMPELKIRASMRREYMERALVEVHAADKRRAKETTIKRERERRRAEEAERLVQEEQTEKRLQRHYNETVEKVVATGRLCWGGGAGGVLLIVGLMALYYANIIFLSDLTRLIATFAVFTALTGVGVWRSMTMGVSKIESHKKNLDVFQNEASLYASEVVNQKYPKDASGKSSSVDETEVAAATREETSNQMRLLRRASITAMVHLNTLAGWAFGAGAAGLLIGFIAVFIFDTMLGTDLGGARSSAIFTAMFLTLLFGGSAAAGGYFHARKNGNKL